MTIEFEVEIDDSELEEISKSIDAASKEALLDFCDAWPVAKQVLEVLRGAVPGFLWKTAITGLIKLGDRKCN